MYRVIEAQKANFTVTRMTGLLAVPRSGFYKWRAAGLAGPSPTQARRALIDVRVKEFHDASDQVYRSPRILALLDGLGHRSPRAARPLHRRVPPSTPPF